MLIWTMQWRLNCIVVKYTTDYSVWTDQFCYICLLFISLFALIKLPEKLDTFKAYILLLD